VPLIETGPGVIQSNYILESQLTSDEKFIYATTAFSGDVLTFARDGSTGRLTLIQTTGGFVPNIGTGIKLSPDNKFLYVISNSHIIVYSRDNATGLISRVDGQPDYMDATGSLTFSPDGKNVYIASYSPRRIIAAARNTTTGLLTNIQEVTPSLSPRSSVISPDGLHLYVGVNEGIEIYNRDATTGLLTFYTQAKYSTPEGGALNPFGPAASLKLTINKAGTRLYADAVSLGKLTMWKIESTGDLTLLDRKEPLATGTSSISDDGILYWNQNGGDGKTDRYTESAGALQLAGTQQYDESLNKGLALIADHQVSSDGEYLFFSDYNDNCITSWSSGIHNNSIMEPKDRLDVSELGLTDGLVRTILLASDQKNLYAYSASDNSTTFRIHTINVGNSKELVSNGDFTLTGELRSFQLTSDGKFLYTLTTDNKLSVYNRDAGGNLTFNTQYSSFNSINITNPLDFYITADDQFIYLLYSKFLFTLKRDVATGLLTFDSNIQATQSEAGTGKLIGGPGDLSLLVSSAPTSYYNQFARNPTTGALTSIQTGFDRLGNPTIQDRGILYPSKSDDGGQPSKTHIYNPDGTLTIYSPSGTEYLNSHNTTAGNEFVFSSASDITYAVNSSRADAVVIAKYKTTLPPAPPENITATPQDRAIKLDWSPRTGSNLKYAVYASLYSDPSNAVKLGETTSTTYTQINIDDRTYYYVKTVSTGAESVFSLPVSAIPLDSPPAGPVNLALTPGAGYVKLSWTLNAESDFDHYQVRRDEVDNFAGASLLANNVTTTTFTDNTAEQGVTYFYWIIAVDARGNSSHSVVSGSEIDIAPAAPLLVNTNSNIGYVSLAWQANTERDLQGYTVYRSTTQNVADAVAMESSADRNVNDLNALEGHTYYYWVTAYDLKGNESAKSAMVSGMVVNQEPPAPVFDMVVTGDRFVEIRWTTSPAHAPDPNFFPDFKQANVYRSTSDDVATATFVGSTATGSNYTDLTALYNVTYYYWVDNEDTGGLKSSKVYMSDGMAVNAPPAAPANVSGTVGIGYIDLAWQVNSETDFDHYDIYRSTNPDDIGSIIGTASASGYHDHNTTYDVLYYYAIVAVDASGNESDPSDSFPILMVNLVPTAPTGITVTPDKKAVVVSWNMNPEDDVQLYHIYRATSSDPGTFTMIGSTSMTSFTDTNVEYNLTYIYMVVAFDGNSEGPHSSLQSITIPPQDVRPLTPQISSIGLINNELVLTWSATTDTDIKNYLIYRSTENDTVKAQIISIVDASVKTYSDNTAPVDQQLFYWIIAADNARQFSRFGTSVTYAITGLEERPMGISIYPNPATSTLFVSDPGSVVEWISVVDMSGRLVSETPDRYLYIGSISPGLYIVNIRTSNGHIRLKLEKK
jgi:fibronectin type 3 domain-containing protein/6-phosphogluconolactonase (cycloisomerase 2 family)